MYYMKRNVVGKSDWDSGNYPYGIRMATYVKLLFRIVGEVNAHFNHEFSWQIYAESMYRAMRIQRSDIKKQKWFIYFIFNCVPKDRVSWKQMENCVHEFGKALKLCS